MLANKILLRELCGDGGLYLCAEDSALAAYEVEGGSVRGGAQILDSCRTAVFDAIIDSGNGIHILLGDDRGGITYIQREGGRWLRGTLLRAHENAAAKIGYVRILRHNMLFSAIYTVLSQNGNILCSQLINGGSGDIDAVDRIDGEKIFPVLDSGGNIFVFYSSYAQHRFGYKTLRRGKTDWSEFTAVSDSAKITEFFALPADGRIYLCFKVGGEIRFRTIEHGADGDILTRETALTRRHGSGCLSPILDRTKGGIELLWARGNTVFSSQSTDGGGKWLRLAEERLAERAEIFKICDAADGAYRFELGYNRGKRFKNRFGNDIYERSAAAPHEVRSVGSRAEDFAGIERQAISYNEIERQKDIIRKKLGISGGNDSFEIEDYPARGAVHDKASQPNFAPPPQTRKSFASDTPQTEYSSAEKDRESPHAPQYSDELAQLMNTVSELKSELVHLKNYLKFTNKKDKVIFSAKHNKKP